MCIRAQHSAGCVTCFALCVSGDACAGRWLVELGLEVHGSVSTGHAQAVLMAAASELLRSVHH